MVYLYLHHIISKQIKSINKVKSVKLCFLRKNKSVYKYLFLISIKKHQFLVKVILNILFLKIFNNKEKKPVLKPKIILNKDLWFEL